jgi:hypothetical protein
LRSETRRPVPWFDFNPARDYPPPPPADGGPESDRLSGRVQLTLYSKARCGLCEEAHDVIQRVRQDLAPSLSTSLEVVDITTSSELMSRYRYDIPVLLVGGSLAFRHRIDPARLSARLLHGLPAPLEEVSP